MSQALVVHNDVFTQIEWSLVENNYFHGAIIRVDGEIPINFKMDELMGLWLTPEKQLTSNRNFPFTNTSSWRELYRVVRPGGHVLALATNETVDITGIMLRLANFEVRDSLQINYGCRVQDDRFATDNIPVWIARKPLSERTVALNVLKWGTGGLNIDGSRIPSGRDHLAKCLSVVGCNSNRDATCYGEWKGVRTNSYHEGGRFPANALFDGIAADFLDQQSGWSESRKGKPRKGKHGEGWGMTHTGKEYNDRGGASRFFYVDSVVVERDDKGVVRPTNDLLAYLENLITPSQGQCLKVL